MKKVSFENLKDISQRTNGLDPSEVTKQLLRFGKNEIAEVTGNPWIEIALDTVKDPMIWFLFGIGIIFVIIGNTSEAIVLFAAILPLLLMDAFLHWRTQASTLSLKSQLAAQATVLRPDREITVNSSDLVPGDLIMITPGLFLPADGVFQKVYDLQVDESALTGESLPISKRSATFDPFLLSEKGETLIDSNTLGYAGTRVLTGSGKMRVLLTGQQTSYGEIIQSVSKLPHERTPLQKSISKLVRGLIFAAGALCLLLAFVRLRQGHGWLDALLSAATLAVAAIPEEFPVVFIFFLSVGVYRLAKRKAYVRKSVSVENIGRVTHICTDKTGTITIGVLQLTHLVPTEVLSEQILLETALRASNQHGSDPVDIAIRERAKTQNIAVKPTLKIFPFTEDRKRETTLIQLGEGQVVAYMKGAPETIISRSNLPQDVRLYWKQETRKWAQAGHKVLACARKTLNNHDIKLDEEPSSDFEFCGLLAFEDPPRTEVSDAIEYCQKNRIKVLMITGDHQDTALAIAKEIGLGGNFPQVISAEEEPEKFDESYLKQNPNFLRELHVVSRCTPMQKLRIVNGLKNAGEIVAVTGDGVNDVPALKAANIGIAMGERGTRSAKEVASIVLADDNFQTVVDAIREGRQLFNNLKLSFQYLLLIHIPLVLTAAFIPLMGNPIIYLPLHIVWLELIIHPSALLAFQAPANNIHGAIPTQNYFFSRTEILLIIFIGLATSLGLGFHFVFGLTESMDVGHARTKAMVLLMFWSAGIVTAFTKLKTRSSALIVFTTFISTIALVQVPVFSKILQLTPLRIFDWITICATVIAFFIIFFVSTFLDSYWKGRSRN